MSQFVTCDITVAVVFVKFFNLDRTQSKLVSKSLTAL